MLDSLPLAGLTFVPVRYYVNGEAVPVCVCMFCAEHPQCYRRVPPQSCLPASVEEKTGLRLSGGGGALS